MAKNSLFSFIKSSFTGGNITTLLDLDYPEDKKTEKEIDDLSEIEIRRKKFTSPSLYLNQNKQPQIPIIGIGGAGVQLLDQVIERINSYGMEYPALAIDTDIASIGKHKHISRSFHIPGADTGTGHQFRFAASRIKKAEKKVQIELNQYFNSLEMIYKHDIVFLLLGSGGTGVGAGIEVAKILIDMGKRPVPFLILPTKEEMSRIRFNAAVALYYFNYAPKDRCLNLTTICIDNELFITNNSDKYYTAVIESANERIAATLGDIIASTELESHAYSADLNEFLEIFKDLKGIGVLQYLQIDNPSKSMIELFDNNIQKSVSLDVDILSATRGYFYISTMKNQISAENYRKLMLRFDNADIFNKLYEIADKEDKFYAIRGIFTGIKYPNRIEELMQLAEDARIRVLNKETESLNVGKVNPKIAQLDDEEEIDVKTGREIVDDRAEDFAKMRRGEDN